MRTIGALVLCTALLLLSTQQAAGLSYELCNSYGAEFVTDSPHLSGLYPFYSLIFMCNGGLNIEGKMVHSCLANGTACGQPAADAYCKYIGFDGSVQDQFQVVPSDEPTRAVSGEWCVNAGQYQSLGALNRTQFDALNATTANAPRCSRLDSVTCFRSRQSLGKAFAGIQQGAAAGAGSAATTHASLRKGAAIREAAQASALSGPSAAGMEVTAVGGRRLKGWKLRGSA